MNCDEQNADNPYAKCGNSQCEICYPLEQLRQLLQDLMDANDQLRARGKVARALEEEVSDTKNDVQILTDALLWLGSSALTGESAGQVITTVRKKVVGALVTASAINSLEISEDPPAKEETESVQRDNGDDQHPRSDDDDGS